MIIHQYLYACSKSVSKFVLVQQASVAYTSTTDISIVKLARQTMRTYIAHRMLE
jgi:hypothetical protein